MDLILKLYEHFYMCIKSNFLKWIVIKTYSQRFIKRLIYIKILLSMTKEEKSKQNTILNVGYCESTSEWLNRIITELADEDKNFLDLSVICA